MLRSIGKQSGESVESVSPFVRPIDRVAPQPMPMWLPVSVETSKLSYFIYLFIYLTFANIDNKNTART